MGRRERNKREKRQRILDAASRLFAENGFEATTTRQISERADVGHGTLFTYFPDKRALLNQLFLEEIEQVMADRVARLDHGAPLVDQLTYLFESFYDYYARDVRLSRVIVKDLLFQTEPDRADTLGSIQSLLTEIVQIVDRQKAAGHVRADVESGTAAFAFFGQYLLTLVSWLSGTIPDPDARRALLRKQLAFTQNGIAAR